jgi:hypothetical protein
VLARVLDDELDVFLQQVAFLGQTVRSLLDTTD